MKTVQGSRDLIVIGRMSIGLSRGTVQWVAAELADLPDCVYYGKKKIDRGASPTQLAKIFPSCGEEVTAKGGNSTHCSGVRLGSGGWGGQQKSTSLHVSR